MIMERAFPELGLRFLIKSSEIDSFTRTVKK